MAQIRLLLLLEWRSFFRCCAGGCGGHAIFRPRWFCGHHLVSMRLGFALSQFLGRVVLALMLLLIVTPAGLILRLAGKDALPLERQRTAATCWLPVRDTSPFDRLF